MPNKGYELVSWKGVLDPGFQVVDDGINNFWISKAGYIYNEGYSCLREMQDKAVSTLIFRVLCKIYSSTLKKPLFECSVETDDSQPQVFTAINPTAAMQKVFNCTGITPKRTWNGNHFFGLHRKDVIEALKLAPKNKNDNSQNTNITTDIAETCDSRYTSLWGGVISIGNVDACNNFNAFTIPVGSKLIYLPPGFESVRNVKLDEKKSIPLHCKIEDKDGQPLFSCVTTQKPEISVSSFKISAVVRLALKKLDVTASRRWSGYDFFGLSHSNTIKQIQSKQKLVIDEKEKKQVSLPKILKDVLNIQHRNAGPTHTLCRKAQKQRNEVIHQLVQFATFGDLKGIYLWVFCFF